MYSYGNYICIASKVYATSHDQIYSRQYCERYKTSEVDYLNREIQVEDIYIH